MNFRKTTKKDLIFVSEHSISRGMSSKQPECIDFIQTLEHEGEILGIGGFSLINTTTVWVWMKQTHLAKNHVKFMCRIVKECLEIFVKEHGIKRAQAYIEIDFPEAIRFIQYLGFERESLMKNFVGNKDAFLYARIY